MLWSIQTELEWDRDRELNQYYAKPFKPQWEWDRDWELMHIEITVQDTISSPVMAHFHCRTQIRIQTRIEIPVLCRYYGKGI